jgi:hypothetical protein
MDLRFEGFSATDEQRPRQTQKNKGSKVNTCQAEVFISGVFMPGGNVFKRLEIFTFGY